LPGDHFAPAHDIIDFVTLAYEDKLKVTDCMYHATMDHYVDVPLSKGIRRMLRDEIFGVKPGTIFSFYDMWCLIPFSFVLDWILPIGRFLRYFDKKNVQAKVIIYNFCESVSWNAQLRRKFTDVNDILLKSPYSGWTAWTPNSQSAQACFTERQYYRYLTRPKEANVPPAQMPRFELPNGVELSFAWALWRSRKGRS
jgi:hypothetical protein